MVLNFFGKRGFKAENGVDVIIADWLIGKVVEVDRFNDRVVKANSIIGDVVSCYSPQAGRSVNEKEEFLRLGK